MLRPGHIRLAREEMDGELWRRQPFDRWHAWVDLVSRAAWGHYALTCRGGPTSLDRGQVLASINHLAQEWGWSRSKVARFLVELIDSGNVYKVKIYNAGTLLAVADYERFGTPKRPPR